jgi:hypothetical protein
MVRDGCEEHQEYEKHHECEEHREYEKRHACEKHEEYGKHQEYKKHQEYEECAEHGSSGRGRLLAGVAWVVLLLALWLWGRGPGEVSTGASEATTGDMAAAGRPPRTERPAATGPLGAAAPLRLDIPGLGVRAPVVALRPDGRGVPRPPAPPSGRPDEVGWYADGVAPGTPGTALLAGHTGSGARPAVLHRVSTLRPGAEIRVARADGTVAEFTVERVDVATPDSEAGAGVHRVGAEAVQRPARAELRLVACAVSAGPAGGGCTADVVVSAHLTGTGP